MSDDYVKALIVRLTRKTVAGRPVFTTPIEQEAADALAAQQAEIARLTQERDSLKQRLEFWKEAQIAVRAERDAANKRADDANEETRRILRGIGRREKET
jgi:hypothetical protein